MKQYKSYTIYFDEKTDKKFIRKIEKAIKKNGKGASNFGRKALVKLATELTEKDHI